MLSKISNAISGIFLGDPVAATEEIYRTADGKFRIHLGLFQKLEEEIIWLKFVHRSFLMKSTSGIGIDVDSFQHFADFLGSAVSCEARDAGVPRKLPFFPLVIVAMSEGGAHSAFLGEYKSRRAPNVVIRFFSFKNRRRERRVVFEYKTSGRSIYEVIDAEVLSLIQREIEVRQRSTRRGV